MSENRFAFCRTLDIERDLQQRRLDDYAIAHKGQQGQGDLALAAELVESLVEDSPTHLWGLSFDPDTQAAEFHYRYVNNCEDYVDVFGIGVTDEVDDETQQVYVIEGRTFVKDTLVFARKFILLKQRNGAFAMHQSNQELKDQAEETFKTVKLYDADDEITRMEYYSFVEMLFDIDRILIEK